MAGVRSAVFPVVWKQCLALSVVLIRQGVPAKQPDGLNKSKQTGSASASPRVDEHKACRHSKCVGYRASNPRKGLFVDRFEFSMRKIVLGRVVQNVAAERSITGQLLMAGRELR